MSTVDILFKVKKTQVRMLWQRGFIIEEDELVYLPDFVRKRNREFGPQVSLKDFRQNVEKKEVREELRESHRNHSMTLDQFKEKLEITDDTEFGVRSKLSRLYKKRDFKRDCHFDCEYVFYAVPNKGKVNLHTLREFKEELLENETLKGLLICDSDLTDEANGAFKTETVPEIVESDFRRIFKEKTIPVRLTVKFWRDDELLFPIVDHYDVDWHELVQDKNILHSLNVRSNKDLAEILPTDRVVRYYDWPYNSIIRIHRENITPGTIYDRAIAYRNVTRKIF